MSAWPQAVWITKQLKRQIRSSFEARSSLDEFKDDLNDWNDEVEDLTDTVNNQIIRIDSLASNIATPVVAQRNSEDEPDTTIEITNGCIWFEVEDQGQSDDQQLPIEEEDEEP